MIWGAISLQTIIEKSYLTNDVTGELDRINKEDDKINNSSDNSNKYVQDDSMNVDNNEEKVG
ncbi:hypothetical protein CcarbDRAFT_4769 [Clostridium carboxidivorans P7]|uniref:Uncharacterized protein n=1 Tax=Clostridium carboxidivorans P7 TaxID=536227 RepID=C6Q152_9CLOT|nr:hypothetical protein [Clostridium carboxidivorans]EET84788.1 hypothetical protein CcarbDRAFT_4769 [Clostridium carboxidivorans P7]